MDDDIPVAVRCLTVRKGADKGDFRRFDRHMQTRMDLKDCPQVVQTLGGFVDWQVRTCFSSEQLNNVYRRQIRVLGHGRCQLCIHAKSRSLRHDLPPRSPAIPQLCRCSVSVLGGLILVVPQPFSCSCCALSATAVVLSVPAEPVQVTATPCWQCRWS